MATVLIIENDPLVAMVLETALTERGYEVITKPDGRLGCEVISGGKEPDLVFTDVPLSHPGGRSLADALRSNPSLKDIPVVLFTDILQGTRSQLSGGSYQGLITKPFDLDEVVETVNTLLGQSAAEGRGQAGSKECGSAGAAGP